MKKYIPYILILALGLVLGWVLFHNKEAEPNKEAHTHTTNEKQLWTCAMHPQIMQPEPGNCPICGMELIPASTSDGALTKDQFRLTENAMALANITTTTVGNGSTNGLEQTLSGTIKVNEEANKVQVSYFTGRIEKLYVNYTGQQVTTGQLLATIYAPELITAQQELITAASLKQTQPNLYKAVVNKLKLWKISDKQINDIEASGTIKQYFPIYATVGGTILDKMVNEGDHVKQGQALFKISNLTSVWAVFDVYEPQISNITNGTPITITSSAFPGKEFTAKTNFIDPVVNTATRTVQLRAVLENTNTMWKPGMFVKGSLAKQQTTSTAITIPASAVLWTGTKSVVYIQPTPNQPVFEMRTVTLGTKTGDTYEIIDGLTNGETVVTNGTFTVDAAAQLQGKPSMMNHDTENKENSTTTKQEKHLRIQVAPEFITQLNQVYMAYNTLKNTLVADDYTGAKNAIATFKTQLEKVDMKLLKNPDAHKVWMPAKKQLVNAITAFGNATSINEQRTIFITISEQMIVLTETFGVQQKVYVQFCPMANTNNGAYWLSQTEEIKNPYFGKAMLTCGNITETIEK